MQNLWLKIKVWTKITIFSLCLIYLVVLIIENANKDAYIWLWFGKDEVHTTILKLIVSMFFSGVLGTLLVRMAIRTVRQIRELKKRGATAQLHQDVADMKAKAAKLQTRPDSAKQGADAASSGTP